MSTRPFNVLIDQDRDGEFQKPTDDVSEHLMGPIGLTASRGRERARLNSPVMAGDFSAGLYNIESQFNDLEPGMAVQWATTGDAGGSLFELEGGGELELEDGGGSLSLGDRPALVIATTILDIPVENPEFPLPSVTLPCKGNLSTLRGKTISTALYQGKTTDELLNIILDEAGWPADKRSIQVGLTAHAVWFLYKADAFQAAEDLQFSEGPGAIIYESRDGWFVFENRDARSTQSRSTMVQATYTDQEGRVRITRQKNFQDIIQAVGITVEEREAQPVAPIWELDSELVLGANEVWKRRFTTSEPFINALLPDSLAVNTIFTLTGSQPLTAGNFKLEYLGVQSSTLAYTLTAGAAETALETLYGAGNLSCWGGPLNVAPIFCELINDYATLSITILPTVVSNTLNPGNIPGVINVRDVRDGGLQSEQQAIVPSGILTAGIWSADITTSGGSGSTNDLPYNATAADVAQEFIDIPLLSLSNTSATGGPLNTAEIIVDFEDLFENIANIIINQTGIMMQTPGATVDIAVSQQGGIADYYITAGTISQIHLSPTDGVTSLLTVIAGPGGATVTGLRVRGQSMPVIRTQEVLYPEDTEDRIADGEDIKIYRPPVLSSVSQATALVIAMLYVLYYEVIRETIKVIVTTSTDSPEMDAEILQEISNRIHAVNEHLNIDGAYIIDKIRHSEAGLLFISEYDCEKVLS